jgi:hypothetical protein
MKDIIPILLIQFAGVLHLGLIWAGLTMPSVVGLGRLLAPLPPFVRNLFYLYYAFIGLVLAAFGALTFFFARAMAAGEPLARALAVLMAVFWLLRLGAAIFVFDVRPYLRNRWLKLGYGGLNLVFVYLLAIYVWIVARGGVAGGPL